MFDRLGHRVGPRALVENPGLAIDHRLSDATRFETDHWFACSHRLDRGDPEVLLAGDQVRVAASKQLDQARPLDPALESDRRTGHGLKSRPLRSVADENQPPPKVVCRLN